MKAEIFLYFSINISKLIGLVCFESELVFTGRKSHFKVVIS